MNPDPKFERLSELLRSGVEYAPETKASIFAATRPVLAQLVAAALRGLGASHQDAEAARDSLTGTASTGNGVKRGFVVDAAGERWRLTLYTKKRPQGGKRTYGVLDEAAIVITPSGASPLILWLSFPNAAGDGGLMAGPRGLQLAIGRLAYSDEAQADLDLKQLRSARANGPFTWDLPGKDEVAFWTVGNKARALWAIMIAPELLATEPERVIDALESMGARGFFDLVRALGKNDMTTTDEPHVSPHPAVPDEPDERVLNLRERLRSRKQVILTGAPGTGKTWLAHEVAKLYAQSAAGIDAEALWQRYREVATPGIALALALERIGEPARVPEIFAQAPVIKYFSGTEGDPANFRNQCHFYLMKYTSPQSKTVGRDVEKRSEPYVFDRLPDKRWQLTVANGASAFEDGDEARAILRDIDAAGPGSDRRAASVRTVTFHPSLSYEDFVEGLRPSVATADGASTLSYRIEPGHFRDAVAQAFANPAADHLLVIDEINRGNLARIFGELITLLEPSKRARRAQPGEEGRRVSELLVPDASARLAWVLPPEAFEVRLAYSKIPFVVPENLHILGTMNSTDRSIALIDFALRRRFYFERLAPDFGLVRNRATEDGVGAEWDVPIRLFEELNGRIEAARDADHVLGHSFLLDAYERAERDDADVADAVGECLREQVIPLISEYVRGDGALLARIFGDGCDLLRNVADGGDDPDYRLHLLDDAGACYWKLVKSVLGGGSIASLVGT